MVVKVYQIPQICFCRFPSSLTLQQCLKLSDDVDMNHSGASFQYLTTIKRDIQAKPLLQGYGEFCFYSKVFSFDKMHLNMQVA